MLLPIRLNDISNHIFKNTKIIPKNAPNFTYDITSKFQKKELSQKLRMNSKEKEFIQQQPQHQSHHTSYKIIPNLLRKKKEKKSNT